MGQALQRTWCQYHHSKVMSPVNTSFKCQHTKWVFWCSSTTGTGLLMRYALQYYSVCVTAHKQTERLQCGYPEFVYFRLESNFNCLKSLSLHFCTRGIHSKTFTKSWTYVEILLRLVKTHLHTHTHSHTHTHTHITYLHTCIHRRICTKNLANSLFEKLVLLLSVQYAVTQFCSKIIWHNAHHGQNELHTAP
jgi:hypothetical protein